MSTQIERQVKLDLLFMRSSTNDEYFRRLDKLMTIWKAAIQDMADEDIFTHLWYVITFRYSQTAVYKVACARDAYEKERVSLDKLSEPMGLYWHG